MAMPSPSMAAKSRIYATGKPTHGRRSSIGVQVSMRIVDLSVPLENDVAADPPGFGPAIQYLGHKDTISSLQMAFAGLKPEDLPDGEGWAIEAIKLNTHNGTHLD